jgi:hypothetical protein
MADSISCTVSRRGFVQGAMASAALVSAPASALGAALDASDKAAVALAAQRGILAGLRVYRGAADEAGGTLRAGQWHWSACSG